MFVVWHPTVHPHLIEGGSHAVCEGLLVDIADVLRCITPATTKLTLHNVELTDVRNILESDAPKGTHFCLEQLFLYEVIPFGTRPDFLRNFLSLFIQIVEIVFGACRHIPQDVKDPRIPEDDMELAWPRHRITKTKDRSF